MDPSISQIIDVRPAERFNGLMPEPRANTPSGRIPGSINIPFTKLLNSDGSLKDTSELEHLFSTVNLLKPIILSCGSGVTATIGYVALESIGAKSISVYDGSWAEFSSTIKD